MDGRPWSQQQRQQRTSAWNTNGNNCHYYYSNLTIEQSGQQLQQQHQQSFNGCSCSAGPRLLAGHCGARPSDGADAPRSAAGRQRAAAAAGGQLDEEASSRTTDCQTMMHILKANIGTGVLAMPLAFRHVGLWTGLALVPLIGAICVHCMNILLASHNRICDRFNYESLDYDQVAALSLACGPKCARRLARWASLVVSLFLMSTQIGFCCVYTLFAVENIQLAMLNLFGLNYSTGTYLLLAFPVIGLASCTSNLKHLARISTLANLLQSAGLALIFYDLLQFRAHGPGQPAVQVQQGLAERLAGGLPLFFATAVYAFEGIGVMLPVVKEMQRPERFQGPNGVLNSSMALVGLLYMGVGFFGYAKYGHQVAGSITLNLPETTLNELVRLSFALAIGLSYSLQFYVPWTIVWPLIDEALFYSYRPRPSRDKLDVLNKLSAANQWALAEALEQQRREQLAGREQQWAPCCGCGLDGSAGHEDLAELAGHADHEHHEHHEHQQRQPNQAEARGQLLLLESNASTLASSYCMSVGSLASRTGYGSLQAGRAGAKARKPRDRLEELLERDSDDEPMPEVQWRPPPTSMRGKRKLVRYTIILVTVSLTFVAAALIPRLDLFISLIGALASSCLAIIFPAIIQLCAFWNCDSDGQHEPRAAGRRRGLGWLLFVAKNLFLVAFGVLGLVTGSWMSLAQLHLAPASL